MPAEKETLTVHEAENLRGQVEDTLKQLGDLRARYDELTKQHGDAKGEIARLEAVCAQAAAHVQSCCDSARAAVAANMAIHDVLVADAKERRRREIEEQKRMLEEELGKMK